jgi:hypothetical protein
MASFSKIVLFLACATSIISSPAAAVHVHGYVKPNGTVVAPYERRPPHRHGEEIVHQEAPYPIRHQQHAPTPPPPAEFPHQAPPPEAAPGVSPRANFLQRAVSGAVKMIESEKLWGLRSYLRYAINSSIFEQPASTHRASNASPPVIINASPPVIIVERKDPPQSDLMRGTWRLNFAKSKYSPGPLPKSSILNIEGEGQNCRLIAVDIDGGGNPTTLVFTHVYDGNFYSTTGALDYDASAYTRVDAYTVRFSRARAGALVQTGAEVLSAAGKTMTVTIVGTDADDQQINNVAVYDKQ